MSLLTEEQISALVDVIIDNISLDLGVTYISGYDSHHNPIITELDITSETQHIRAGARIPMHPPQISYLFLPTSDVYFFGLSSKISNADKDLRYPTHGVAQHTLVEIRAMAVDHIESGYDGRWIANKMIQILKQYVFYYWPNMLHEYRANVLWHTMDIAEDSAFTQGTDVKEFCLRFLLVTTNKWQFTPPGGAASDKLVEEVDLTHGDESGNNKQIIIVRT
jgi:hypothetical protein